MEKRPTENVPPLLNLIELTYFIILKPAVKKINEQIIDNDANIIHFAGSKVVFIGSL
jgi:hypothetical protein